MFRASRLIGAFARAFAPDAESAVIANSQTNSQTNNANASEDKEAGVLAAVRQAQSAPTTGARAPVPVDPDYLRALKTLGRAGNDPRVRLIQNQCLKMTMNLFNRPDRLTRSIGFTSAIPGEGKSFLATLTATTLAERSQRPVTLLDCNWEHPTQHETFQLPESPGLAEWLRGECDLSDIRHAVSQYLSIIPAGISGVASLALTERLRGMGASALLSNPDEALIVDLPSVLTTDYGALLPQALDAVMLVVRAGVTQDGYIAEASRELAEAPLEGAILNGARSDIPKWLLRLL